MSNTAASQYTNNDNVQVILRRLQQIHCPDVPLSTQCRRYYVKHKLRGRL